MNTATQGHVNSDLSLNLACVVDIIVRAMRAAELKLHFKSSRNGGVLIVGTGYNPSGSSEFVAYKVRIDGTVKGPNPDFHQEPTLINAVINNIDEALLAEDLTRYNAHRRLYRSSNGYSDLL